MLWEIMGKIILNLILLTIIFTLSLCAETKIEVSGIIGGDDPVAIINGSIMRTGDEIGEAKIIEITNDYVKFQHKDGTGFFIKRIGEEIPKKPTSKKSIKKSRIKRSSNEYPEEYEMAVKYYIESKSCEGFDQKIELLDQTIRYAQWAFSKTSGEQREKMKILINDAREEKWNIGVQRQEAKTKKQLLPGMNRKEVEEIWGKPKNINKTVGKYGVDEQWCYGNVLYDTDRYAYFEDGVLTSWQE